ncbi:MAG: hypothetical protein ACJAZN_001284 [Planctomycetota bacterium]|jgi:uncharacterized protein YjbI with pentapeptide repeats
MSARPESAEQSEALAEGPARGPLTMGDGMTPPLADPGGESQGHAGADLAGRDFSGCDLQGVNFTGAHLSDTLFVGANLRGALFDDVHAEAVDFTRADLTGASLRRGGFTEAIFDSATMDHVSAPEAFLEGARFMGARLVGADFSRANLTSTRWSEADLSGADFRGATLTEANLVAVNVRGARFDNANLSSARLSRVAGFRRASWLGVDAAGLDRRGAVFVHDFIEDQNFLSEYRSQGPTYEWTYRLWWLTSDCGRSVVRWAICSSVLAAVFALAYAQLGIDYGEHVTPLSPLYFSVVTLTTLGFGDAVPATMAAQAVVMCEVILGYMMLGGLLSLISNKLSRRAS